MNFKKVKIFFQVEPKDMVLVMLQCIILVLFFILPQTWNLSFGDFLRPFGYGAVVLGGALIVWACVSLGKGLSPFPSPNEESRLITTGAFKYIRHPIYSGFISSMLGMAFVWNSMTKLALTVIAFCFFSFKASYEEKKLSQRFKEYDTYKKQTGRFLP